MKADTVKALLAVVDSFEMAKGTLKPDSEAEKKIDSAYQVRLSPHSTSDSATCYGHVNAGGCNSPWSTSATCTHLHCHASVQVALVCAVSSMKLL